jgi:hypothetical protein
MGRDLSSVTGFRRHGKHVPGEVTGAEQMEFVDQIATILRNAAERQRLVPYTRFHSVFRSDISVRERYAILEQAVTALAQLECVDYGVLLALDNGLPGDEFFTRFKGHRRVEYDAAMGVGTCGRSIPKRRVLAMSERARVYAHARQPCGMGALPSGRDVVL